MKTTALLLSLALLAPFARAAEAPIKVGEYASLTGKDASFGQSQHKGVLLALEELNAAGGVLGRPLEVIAEDNQTKSGESATVAKKLLARDKVVALIGEVTSSRSLEVAPLAQAAKVPMIAPGATNPAVTEKGNYIFRVCFIDPFQGTVMAKFAKDELKVKRVALLTSVSSAYSVGLSKFFRETFTAGGGTIVADQKFNEGDKDFRAQLTAIRAAQPDVIAATGFYAEAALICRQARSLGITAPFIGGDGWEAPQLVELGGEAVEGAHYCTYFSAENAAPEVRAFVRRYQARWGQETPEAVSALGYDAIHLIAAAMEKAGGTAGPALRQAIASTRRFPGVTGETTIDEHRNSSKPAVMMRIRGGRAQFAETVAP